MRGVGHTGVSPRLDLKSPGLLLRLPVAGGGRSCDCVVVRLIPHVRVADLKGPWIAAERPFHVGAVAEVG